MLEERVNYLLENNAVILGDCAGFVHEGGHLIDVITDEFGGRIFVIDPFEDDYKVHLDRYVTPKQGANLQTYNMPDHLGD